MMPVQEIVVSAWNAMDSYEPFSRQFARQVAETIASLQPDLRPLHEAVQQIAYSGIGEAAQLILRQTDGRDEQHQRHPGAAARGDGLDRGELPAAARAHASGAVGG